MNSNVNPFEDAEAIEAVLNSYDAASEYDDVLAENNRPVRKVRRSYEAYFRKNFGTPGDPDFRRGSRSQAKLDAARRFRTRRELEIEARARGFRSTVQGTSKPRWRVVEEWFPGTKE